MKLVVGSVLVGALASIAIVPLAACGSSSTPGFSGFDGTGDGGGNGDDDATTANGDDGGSTLVLGDSGGGGACTGLACQQMACNGGATTSLSGTVYAPNGTLPVYNAIVYVPNGPLAAIDAGVSCDQCGTLASGDPIATALSDSAGHFTLTNVPVGTNIPLVIQLGKWRRQTTIATVSACVDNPVTDPNLTRLPKNQSEGNMPHIALTTGGCDNVGCLLPKLGIDASEFGVQTDGPSKAIHVYSSSSGDYSDGFNNTATASSLWRNEALLKTYDIGIFSCECSEGSDSKGGYGDPAFTAVTDYVNAGGRIFTTDFQYVWYKFSPDPNLGPKSSSDLSNDGVGDIHGSDGNPVGDNPLSINESFPKGLALGQWLTKVFPSNPLVGADGGALPVNMTNPIGVDFDAVFNNVASLTSSAQLWSTSDTRGDGDFVPRTFTVNTPAGKDASQQCGKGVHIDAHVTDPGSGNDVVACTNGGGNVGDNGCYPSTCPDPLKEDEAMFAFFFFDLASCIQNESSTPTVPTPR